MNPAEFRCLYEYLGLAQTLLYMTDVGAEMGPRWNPKWPRRSPKLRTLAFMMAAWMNAAIARWVGSRLRVAR
jgi:hypothetical protein